MADYNPYKAPSGLYGPIEGSGPGGFSVGTQPVWRLGNGAIVPTYMANLPPRCVRCNQPEVARVTMTAYWHPAWVYVLLPLGVLPYAIAATSTRRTITLEVPICEVHRSRRMIGMLLVLLGLFGPLGGVFLAMYLESTTPLIVSVVLFFAMMPGIFLRTLLTPKRISDAHAWLRAGEPFLASLPDGPDPF